MSFHKRFGLNVKGNLGIGEVELVQFVYWGSLPRSQVSNPPEVLSWVQPRRMRLPFNVEIEILTYRNFDSCLGGFQTRQCWYVQELGWFGWR